MGSRGGGEGGEGYVITIGVRLAQLLVRTGSPHDLNRLAELQATAKRGLRVLGMRRSPSNVAPHPCLCA